MVTINSNLLKKRIREIAEETGDDGIAVVSIRAKMSVSTLQKLMAGRYESLLKYEKRVDLSKAVELPLDRLFQSKLDTRKRAS